MVPIILVVWLAWCDLMYHQGKKQYQREHGCKQVCSQTVAKADEKKVETKP